LNFEPTEPFTNFQEPAVGMNLRPLAPAVLTNAQFIGLHSKHSMLHVRPSENQRSPSLPSLWPFEVSEDSILFTAAEGGQGAIWKQTHAFPAKIWNAAEQGEAGERKLFGSRTPKIPNEQARFSTRTGKRH
jgi:hypothetical protein